MNNLYNHNSYSSCTQQDSITVYEIVQNGQEKPMRVFCGGNLPPVLMSSTPNLKIIFKAGMHGSFSASGFELNYEFRKGKYLYSSYCKVANIREVLIFNGDGQQIKFPLEYCCQC